MKPNHWARQRKPDGLIREMLEAGEGIEDIVIELGVSENHVKRVKTAIKKEKRCKTQQ